MAEKVEYDILAAIRANGSGSVVSGAVSISSGTVSVAVLPNIAGAVTITPKSGLTRNTVTFTEADAGTLDVIASPGASLSHRLWYADLSVVNTAAAADDVVVTVKDGAGANYLSSRCGRLGQNGNKIWDLATFPITMTVNQKLQLTLAGTTFAGRIVTYTEPV